MSRTQVRRLEKASVGLSPRQLVLADLDEAHGHRSILAYAASRADSVSQSDTLCGRIEASVTATLKGRDPRTIHHAVREAQKEGLFLARLASGCEFHILEQIEAWELRWALLFSEFRRLVEVRRADGQSEPDPSTDPEVIRAAIPRHWQHLVAERMAVEWVERVYFGGRPVVFASTRARLGDLIGRMETLAGEVAAKYAAGPAEGPRRRTGGHRAAAARHLAIDPREVAEAGRRESRCIARWLVDHARALALSALGEEYAAAGIMRLYVPPGAGNPRTGA